MLTCVALQLNVLDAHMFVIQGCNESLPENKISVTSSCADVPFGNGAGQKMTHVFAPPNTRNATAPLLRQAITSVFFGKRVFLFVSERIFLCSSAEIAVPDYWDPQPQDSNGKGVSLHIVHLDPANNPNHMKEHKKISDSFLQSANNHTILKIQNPSLFKLYSTKKQSMDEQSGSNEKFLFHGTAAKNVPDINQNGLNRSYKGVNGEV